MPDAPDIDFARIRPYGQPASRSGAFEELASILIEQGAVEWPEGTRFHRFGNPDGGREGRGILPGGDVWAWQAKYLFEFDDSAANQVARSLRRAIDSEPRLARYFVAMPFDLPAGDTDKRTSAATRWEKKSAEWAQMARDKGLDVEFAFVGAHQLLTALTEPRHAGRARYWFGADVLTREWQRRRLEEAIAKVGPRYTPRLHVEVDTVQALDAVGRVDEYVLRWQQALAALTESRRWGLRAPDDHASEFEDPLATCGAALDDADRALEAVISAARGGSAWPPVEDVLGVAADALGTVDDLLHQRCLTKDGYLTGNAGSLYSDVRKAVSAVHRGGRLARSVGALAARQGLLLVTGRAGVGKTHLLCDVASRRVSEERPTILLLGPDFDGRPLLQQIAELTQLGGSLDDVLAVLDAAGEAAGCVGMLIVDALNESERPERWRSDVRALAAAAARFRNVAVVLSCRTEFVGAVIGDGDELPAVEHVGFAEATDAAILRFTHEFGLEPPTFPVLNPEFSNPLFLKLTCEALATLGATRFPFGAAGLVTVCNAFIEAVNKRLSEPSRCDYDERSDPVARVVRGLALLGGGPFDRAEAQRITEAELPARPWSRSLMRGLVAEGVLLELSDGRLAFGYQRLGDMNRAVVIAEGTPEEIRFWLAGLGADVWRERGVLGALAVVVPERHKMELTDLAVDDEGRVPYEMADGFLESLVLREPTSVTPRAVEIVERMLDGGYRIGDIWDRLMRVACIPGHPLNAKWLHMRLAAMDVGTRDASWSTRLVGAVDPDEETAVGRLIDWAWPAELASRRDVPDNVASLATHVLGWLLTTSDRRVRDSATKALVSIGERAPAGFAAALRDFRGVNDPYVLERLMAAACGTVLRTVDTESSHAIADAVQEVAADGWPEHLVARDFIRRVFGVARASGWSGPDGLPPYGAKWPPASRPINEIEGLAGPPDYAYGSIWHSLTGWGDFGRHVLQSALHDVESEDAKALRHDAERAIFDRALELGWTPERFGEIDRTRSSMGRSQVVERVGKKYQWIGFYEVLGRIADNHEVKPAWGDRKPRPYEYAEQLVWRDTDPTILARTPAVAGSQPPWFSPVEATLPARSSTSTPPTWPGFPTRWT